MIRTGFCYSKVPLKILLNKAHKEKRVETINEWITKNYQWKRPFLVMRKDSVWKPQMTEGRISRKTKILIVRKDCWDQN